MHPCKVSLSVVGGGEGGGGIGGTMTSEWIMCEYIIGCNLKLRIHGFRYVCREKACH